MTHLKESKRIEPRNPTEAGIACRPFTSGFIKNSDGVMRNFSSVGSYIETSGKFEPGTILLVRMTQFPSSPSSNAAVDKPRSISLAEIKWVQELTEGSSVCYGMGVRYLE